MIVAQILDQLGSQPLQERHERVRQALAQRDNQVGRIAKNKLIVVQVLVIILLIATVVIILSSRVALFAIHALASLAHVRLVKQLLNEHNDPLDMVLKSAWTHFISQVANALEHLLDDLFVTLRGQTSLQVGEEKAVEHLLDLSR